MIWRGTLYYVINLLLTNCPCRHLDHLLATTHSDVGAHFYFLCLNLNVEINSSGFFLSRQNTAWGQYGETRNDASMKVDLDGSSPFVTSLAVLCASSPLLSVTVLHYMHLQDIYDRVFPNHIHGVLDGLTSLACQVEGMDAWILFERISRST